MTQAYLKIHGKLDSRILVTKEKKTTFVMNLNEMKSEKWLNFPQNHLISQQLCSLMNMKTSNVSVCSKSPTVL